MGREQLANLINSDSSELVFTSGLTEAISLGLIGYFLANKEKGNHIISMRTEHKTVIETLNYLESIGC